ncbi:pep-cterm sorting domain-containing protein [Anaeramoeba ignava]|uniref:Pep-cterm sorting domain-containing protein n=1 Tax=Anaeramoeba ignava TaxID=1746090 RepID=A0A9Q0LUR3_ANAIG|nr:pep-cterm sorting domain-containing protein [Anaeramoeba ignava]
METYSNLEKLSNDLKNLFQNQNQNQNENENENESYFDFEIICQQNQQINPISFKTHKSILSSRSQYFKSLFNSKMKEYQENKMILNGFSIPTLNLILNYFYSGKIEINLENVIEILFFSSKYLIDELIEICSKIIKNNLQFETVVDILKLSEAMKFNQLLNSSYQFILENINEFIKTSFFLELEENQFKSIISSGYISLNEFELFQLIIKWGKHKLNINQEKENEKLEKKEKEQIQNQISNIIIEQIQFNNFSEEEINKTLKDDLIPKQISEQLIQFQKLQNDQNNEAELEKLIQIQIQSQNQYQHQNQIQNQFQNLHQIQNSTNLKLNSKPIIIRTKKNFNKLKEWINDDEFFSKMKLGFSAKRNGFNCKKWHDKCDNKGKTLIIIKTKDNYIFGGFTSIGFTNDKSKWREEDRNRDYGYIPDSKAFIFSLRNNKNNRNPHKFPIKKDQEQYAILYHYLRNGANFGYGADFCLNSSLRSGWSNFGNSYKLPKSIKKGKNEAKSYLAGSFNSWKVDEVETYFL